MRLGIISDIHSNIEALTTVLALFQREKIDQIFCLGDILGYNANPVECVELLREHEAICISGNHDRFVSGKIDAVIRPETRKSVDHCRKLLNEEQMDFIASLSEEYTFLDTFEFVHGSLRHKDEYINSLQVARGNLQLMAREYPGIAICFYGHTHLPYIISKNHIETDIHYTRTFELNRQYGYLINPGSVGQPRDQCPKTSCVIFDTDAFAISYFRLDYDISSTQRSIHQRGLDPKLANRLALGR